MRKLQVRNYSFQPLQTSYQPVVPDTSSSSEGVSFTEVNEFPPAGFLHLYNHSIGYVSYTALRKEADIGSAFITNYNQMKIIAEKNHGKVFEQVGDRVYLWENVKDIVLKMYEIYKS